MDNKKPHGKKKYIYHKHKDDELDVVLLFRAIYFLSEYMLEETIT